MKKTILLSLFFVFYLSSTFAQMPAQRITLPMLGLKNESLKISLEEVSKCFSSKPNGMKYPVSKVKFLGVKEGFSIEVVGIDNSWRNLFNMGEVPYGYTVVNNRLFIIMGLAREEIDLNNLFFVAEGKRVFNKMHLPSEGVETYPKWYFEHTDGQTTKIREENIEILDR